MRKKIFRLAEAVGVLSKTENALKGHLGLEGLYGRHQSQVQHRLTLILESHRRYFARYGEFNPALLSFEPFDQGSYGNVFASPCKRFVIRLSRDNDDDAYGTFVGLALKRQGNPFYPKVYCHLQCGSRHLVLMEYLEPLSFFDLDARAFVSSTRDRLKMRIPVKDGQRHHHPAGYSEIVEDIIDIAVLFRHNIDLNGSNVMMRPSPDGAESATPQYVITDPLC